MRKPEIERVFEMYNAVLFGGRLHLPNIMVRRMRDCARWYEPEPERDEDRLLEGYNAMHTGLGLLIVSSTAHHRMTWRATVLHEMVHMAVGGIEEPDPHGPLFVAEANRVARLIGLEECIIEDAWNWPAHHLDLLEDEQNILDEG
jgi:hypothetical protein